MSARNKSAPAELRQGEHARLTWEDRSQRDRPVPVRVVCEHGSALGHFFPGAAAGLDDGRTAGRFEVGPDQPVVIGPKIGARYCPSCGALNGDAVGRVWLAAGVPMAPLPKLVLVPNACCLAQLARRHGATG